MSAATSALLNPDLSETDLMTRARHGDRAAFGRVVHLYLDRLHNTLLRLVGEPQEAAELTQETFSRAWTRIAEWPQGAEPYPWLLRGALNLAIAAVRRGRRRKFSADDPHHVLAAMGRLEMDYRAALVLRDVERLSYAQMADVLGLGQATVKSRLFRARLALRDELKG